MFFDTRGDGPRLSVGIHGMPTAPDVMWPALPVDTHRCVNVHLPGYGRTPVPEDGVDLIGVETELIDTFDLDGAVIAGHSAGSWRALSLALRPEVRPAALVLIAPFAGISAADAPAFQAFADALRAGVDLTDIARGRNMTVAEQGLPGASRVEGWLASTTAENLADELEAMVAAPHLAGRLGELDLPVLLLGGGEDVICPPESVEAMAASLPWATVEFAAGAGHALPVFRPQWVAGAVRRFLDCV